MGSEHRHRNFLSYRKVDDTDAIPKSARLAVVRYAYGEGPPTYNLIVGQLCDRFHKLPEEVERSGIARLLQMTGEVDLLTSVLKMQSGQQISPEEHSEVGDLLQWDLERQKDANRR